jgi:dTDP-4-amino-4,6-dideoxygalactose transaminase
VECTVNIFKALFPIFAQNNNEPKVISDFESALSEYTGAPFVVAVSSCTSAILLSLAWEHSRGIGEVYIPQKTYVGVPQSAKQAGMKIHLVNKKWNGVYRFYPTKVWDCAKRTTGKMYIPGQIQCLSFYPTKPFGLKDRGGAILHDNKMADIWFRKARWHGRTEGVLPKDDNIMIPAWDCRMVVSAAKEGIKKLKHYPVYVPDQEMHDYPDLSRFNWNE